MSAYDTNHARVMAKLDKIETLLLAVIKQQEPVLPIRPAALPPPQTNALGAPLYFRLVPTLTVALEGRHL